MKFKVGDRVKVINKSRYCYSWFDGRIGIIVDISFGNYGVVFTKSKMIHWFSESELEYE